MEERFDGEAGVFDELVLVQVEERLRTALHEIKQPVAAVLALAEAARGLRGTTADMRDHLDLIIEQVLEVSGAALSVLGRGGVGDPPDPSPVDVDEVLDSVLASYARMWTGTLTRHGECGGARTNGSRPAIRRCLVNVVDNAVRAAGPAGEVVVTVLRGADSVRIVVEDDGPGFGGVPGGSGIGLSVTRRELQAIGGSVSPGVPSGLGGARVAMSIPLRVEEPACLDPTASTG